MIQCSGRGNHMTETTIEQFEKWLKAAEDIDLEFKLASNNFDSSRGSLFDYCAAIANSRGGKEASKNRYFLKRF